MIKFISGNSTKIELYKRQLARYSTSFEPQALSIEEIQSDSTEKIVLHKAQQAFDQLEVPLFVNDASWEIPALNGFPGPYMKYMNQWFSSEDFLKLMTNKSNETINLVDYFCCMDSSGSPTIFKAVFAAKFLPKAAGGGSSIDRVVALDGSTEPLSIMLPKKREEVLAQSPVWEQLANWIKKSE